MKLDEIGCKLETWSDGVNRGGDKSSVGQDYRVREVESVLFLRRRIVIRRRG